MSWLGAWLLLLGFRDFSCEQHMRQGLPCLRPSEEAMVQAAQVWSRIAAAAEVSAAANELCVCGTTQRAGWLHEA